MALEPVLRLVLPAYLLAYLLSACVWRARVVRQRTGINPIVLSSASGFEGFLGKAFALTIGLACAAVMAYAIWPVTHDYFVPIRAFDRPWLRAVSLVLIWLSLAWILIAQAQMGLGWRLGVDVEHPTDLVDTGLFRRSRNPIFLGILASTLGLFLALPNAVMLLVLVLNTVLLRLQVRVEEEHLARAHGDAYRSYCRRVRRWM